MTAAPVTAPPHIATTRAGLTLAAMCLAAAMTFLEITATVTSLTAIQADLHVSPSALVWVASAYTLPVAALVLSAGTLGGLFGRKRVLGVGIAVMVAGSLLLAAAPNIAVVLLGQAVAGIGGALILPNSIALLTVTFTDPHRRTEAIGLWAASSGLGLAAGPIISGALLDHFSWHTIFLTNVALGALTLALALPAVTESRHPGQRLDLPGLLLGTLAVFALVFAAIEGGHRGYTHPLVFAGLLIFLAALGLFLLVELRADAPMIDVRLLRSRSFTTVLVVAAVALFGFTGVSLLVVLFLQRVQGLSALETGVRLLPQMAAFVFTSALTGRLIRRTGFTVPMVTGLVLAGLASLALLGAAPDTGYPLIGLPLTLFGAGLGAIVAASTAAAMTSVGAAQAPMASGLVNTFRQVGAVLGTSVLGTILTSRTASDLPASLTTHGVSAVDRQAVLHAAAHGSVQPGTIGGQARAAVDEAVTVGLHAGLLVNGLIFLAAAAAAALYIRHRPHHDQ